MSFCRLIAAATVAVLIPAMASAQSPVTAGPASVRKQIELPPDAAGKPFPYTVDVPAGWEMRQVKDVPGVFLGPADAVPPNDPRLVYVRLSPTPLTDPQKTVENIRAADAQSPWSAPFVEARQVNGIPAVFLRMDSGEGDKARSTLVLKLPMDQGGVDLLGSAPRAEFAKLLPVFQKVFFSVRRVPEKTEKK